MIWFLNELKKIIFNANRICWTYLINTYQPWLSHDRKIYCEEVQALMRRVTDAMTEARVLEILNPVSLLKS